MNPNKLNKATNFSTKVSNTEYTKVFTQAEKLGGLDFALNTFAVRAEKGYKTVYFRNRKMKTIFEALVKVDGRKLSNFLRKATKAVETKTVAERYGLIENKRLSFGREPKGTIKIVDNEVCVKLSGCWNSSMSIVAYFELWK